MDVIFLDHTNTLNDDQEKIIKLVNKGHNILYENENIEGERALNDIMHFIFLRLLENKITDKPQDGKIDLLNKEYYQNIGKTDEELDEIFKYYDIKNIIKEELGTVRSKNNDVIKELGKIFHYHPVLEKIYDGKNFINAEKPVTIKILLNECISKFDIEKFYNNDDTIGIIYENFLNKYTKTGSKLGQYFTPRKMMKLVLEFMKPTLEKYIKKKVKYEVADLCCGTCGWLVLFYNIFKKKYSDKINFTLNEVKPSTFQIGLMNIISTINKIPKKAVRDNCLTHIDDNKYDLILTNPPFRTDFKFKNIEENYSNDKTNIIDIDKIYKLKSNNPIVQFLEMYIYKVKENGRCIIVLPFGQLFFGKMMKKVRKYLIEIIDIEYIIEFESGIFTHTGIKTCIMVFKKCKGKNNITFLKANEECNKLFKIGQIEKFNDNFSFYYRDYFMEKIDVIKKYDDDKMIEFGEIFTLEKGKIQSSKVIEDKDGEGVLVNWSLFNKYKKIKKYSLIGENLFISTSLPNGKNGGYIVISYWNGKCDFCNLMSRLVIKDKFKNKINIKFYYYYLKHIHKFIEKNYQLGSCNKKLDIDNFNKMLIPLLSIEQQNEIVNDLDLIEETNKKSKEIIDNITKMNELYLKSKVKEYKKKSIKDLCKFEKQSKRLAVEGLSEGTYNFYSSSVKIKKINEYDYENNCLIIGSGGNINIHYDNHFSCSADNIILSSKNEEILRYIFHYLNVNKQMIENGFKGATIKHLSKEYFENLIIPLPSIENLDEINEYFNKNEEFINKLNDNIINNNVLVSDILLSL